MDYLLCNRLDLGDLSRVQEHIRGTAGGIPDIERDDEFPLGPDIW